MDGETATPQITAVLKTTRMHMQRRVSVQRLLSRAVWDCGAELHIFLNLSATLVKAPKQPSGVSTVKEQPGIMDSRK